MNKKLIADDSEIEAFTGHIYELLTKPKKRRVRRECPSEHPVVHSEAADDELIEANMEPLATVITQFLQENQLDNVSDDDLHYFVAEIVQAFVSTE